MEGILNIDKPEGITSHDVVNRVRRICGLRRVGHAGTLDPLATGVLVVCVGRATRLAEYVVGQPKEYVAVVRLGQTTDTYDADGTILEEHPVSADSATIQTALQQFTGPIEQIPPMYSAIKRDGQPLYKLARQGIEVERKARAVTIYNLALEDRTENDITLRVACSTGTYIRSLAHDLGEVLGCGGHIVALRRTRVGSFSAENAVALDQLTSENALSHLQPTDQAVTYMPRLDLDELGTREIGFGRRIAREEGVDSAELCRAYDVEGRFVGILRAEETQWKPRKIFHHE